jgi:hypothetical protein
VELANRRSEIEGAVALAAEIIQSSASAAPAESGWRVKEVEAKFGLTLTAEAGAPSK